MSSPSTAPSAHAKETAQLRPLTIALIGNPNTGKSTLFNALTRGKARIGNYPGVTVEKKIGKFQHQGRDITLIDLPGTYSLAPRSADEMVSVDVLLGRQKQTPPPDAVICIVDASNLERNLYLFSQIRDLGLPVLLVLNMADTARQRGIEIATEDIEKKLGVPVVTTTAHRREGIDEVRDAVLRLEHQLPPREQLFPAAFYTEVSQLQDWLAANGLPEIPAYLRERMLLDVHGESEHRASLSLSQNLSEYLTAARTRLNEAGCRIPLVETKVRYDWIRQQLDGAIRRTQPAAHQTTSDRIDRILTHRVWGVLLFALLMFAIFQVIFAGADPLIGAVEGVQESISGFASGLIPPGILRSLVNDGIIAGVGSVLVFLPQIVLLFTFIALMEDCGYMARAAFLMDKLMTRIGLSGKSFLPLMSSFACAIPGVMSTRVIENRRDRMITILIAPLMSCSARLPVYLLLTATFIPATAWLGGLVQLQGLVLFVMYSLGALVAIPIAWLLKKTFFKGETPPFVMELPPYRWPSLRIVWDRVYESAKAFVVRAGSLIFCITILIWAAGYFPGDRTSWHQLEAEIEAAEGDLEEVQGERDAILAAQEQVGEQNTPVETERISAELARLEPMVQEREAALETLQGEAQVLGARLTQESYLGRFGQAIEPAVIPLGWDWRLGVGAIASFPAREVIIATLGTIFSLGDDVDEEDEGLRGALQAATWPDGRPLFTIPVALSVMVFFALCAQCGATLMVIRRETNSWRWPVFTFFYMTALAYVAALVVYQTGTALMG